MELLKKVDSGRWLAIVRLEKYDVDALPQDPHERKRFAPFETIELADNLLVTGAVSATGGGVNGMWDRLIGNTTVPAYSNANARIGVGDGNGSVPSPANGDTDLTASTNKLRKGMNGGYPTAPTSRGVSFQSDFTSGEANFVWNEWGVFNTNTAAQGMLNHKGENLGTKASGTWTLTVTLSIT
jgi:hypothetical protein